jgi:hypothetical protein
MAGAEATRAVLCGWLVDNETQGNVLKKVIRSGLAGVIVFLVAIMPVGAPDQVTGERPRLFDEVTNFIEDDLF